MYRIGKMSKLFTPNLSSCGKCKTTWGFVEPHNTQYSRCYGMFPLCEECWSELTPQERLPYYEQLIKRWGNVSEEDKTLIREAVLAGK